MLVVSEAILRCCTRWPTDLHGPEPVLVAHSMDYDLK